MPKIKVHRILVVLRTGRKYYADLDKMQPRINRGEFFWRTERSVEEIEPRFRIPLWDGFLGTGNAIPFAPIPNRLKAPPKIHYPIPAVGAHTRVMRCAWNNYIPQS